MVMPLVSLLFFLTTSATAQIYTLSLHDALPISLAEQEPRQQRPGGGRQRPRDRRQRLVLDPRGPGRHRVVEGPEPVGAGRCRDADALALEVLGVVERSGIAKARRRVEPQLGGEPLAFGQRWRH